MIFCGEGWPAAWGYGKVEIYFSHSETETFSTNQFGNDNRFFFHRHVDKLDILYTYIHNIYIYVSQR